MSLTQGQSPAPLGLAIGLGAFLLFAALTGAALSGQATLAAADALVAQALQQHLSAAARGFLSFVSALHVPRGILALTALVAALLLWRRDGRGLLRLLAVVPCGATLNHLLKHALQRPRPGLEHAVAAVTDFSFPSGHAANATLLYGFVAMWLMPHLRWRWARAAVAFAVALMVGLVSGSRVALGAHRLSDVVAGVLLGVAWIALCRSVATRLRDSAAPR